MKTLTLAAAQITCQDGKVMENLTRATQLAEQAQSQGAQLVLLPEFMSQVYLLTPALWDSAEAFAGPTTRWPSETARRLGIYLGTSFLEARNGHFLNTFALAEPSGKIVDAVRKRNPSMWEAYFFYGELGALYLDTELGRISVGICFDNHTYEYASAMLQSSVDLILMPHSYCTPIQPTKVTSQEDIDRLNCRPGLVARLYNEWFGVSVLMCNKRGMGFSRSRYHPRSPKRFSLFGLFAFAGCRWHAARRTRRRGSRAGWHNHARPGPQKTDPPAQVQPLHLPRLTGPRNYPPDGMAQQLVLFLQQAAQNQS